MIRYFRNRRMGLLEQGKWIRYLQYTVGEILLIVTGILIALGINNWNQARKDRAFEVTMLRDVKSSLEGENGLQWYIAMLQSRVALADSSANEIKRLLAKTDVPADSFMRHIDGLNTGIMFTFDKGPYEAIKSVGLDKISSDSLRTVLSNTYDFALPRLKDLLEDHYIKLNDEAYHILYHKILGYTVLRTDDGNVDIQPVAIVDDLSQNPDFLRYIRLRQNAAQHAAQRLNTITVRINHLQRLLDKELKTGTH